MNFKKMNLLFIIFSFVLLFIPIQSNAQVDAPKKECHAYVVMDAGSGEVLFGQDYDKQIYPASTAKLMTAIVCIENGDVNSKIKTQYDVVYGTTPGTYCLGIGANVTYSFKDLLSMSLIASAADATDSLAVGVFGSKKACVEAMNQKCQELGLTQTHFDNPVGSDTGAGYNETYATAREMALITRYAMSIPLIRDTVKKSSYSAKDVTCNTTNWFIRGMAYYDESKYKVIGTKSGTTNAAGHVFIATAKDKQGHEVICAYFGNVSKASTFTSIRKLLDYTFSQYKKGNLTLTPANYDVRCSGTFGQIYSKYAYLNVYPGETDGTFHKNTPVTRTQMGSIIGGVNELSDRAILANFVSDNKNGKVTSASLASLVQEFYPTHISKEKVEEILAGCTHTEGLTDEEKEAFAVYVNAGLCADDSCKNASQIITRQQAILFADLFRNYQMEYETTHYVRANLSDAPQNTYEKSEEAIAEEQKENSKDSKEESTEALSTEETTVTVQSICPGITILNSDWMNILSQDHAAKEAERLRKQQEAAQKAAEEAAAAEAATATDATTAADPTATTSAPTDPAATTAAQATDPSGTTSTDPAATTAAPATDPAATTAAPATDPAATTAATVTDPAATTAPTATTPAQ